MTYKSIEEIYSEHDSVQKQLEETLSGLSEERVNNAPIGEKWSIAQVVEHIALVENGIVRICTKLLGRARDGDRKSDGTIQISDDYINRSIAIVDAKLEAPDIVKPVTGKSVADSLNDLKATAQRLDEIRPMFEAFDSTDYKYPHPFFGDMSAAEWLVLAGGHKARHLRQIGRLMDMTK